jgi:hypothetical protein
MKKIREPLIICIAIIMVIAIVLVMFYWQDIAKCYVETPITVKRLEIRGVTDFKSSKENFEEIALLVYSEYLRNSSKECTFWCGVDEVGVPYLSRITSGENEDIVLNDKQKKSIFVIKEAIPEDKFDAVGVYENWVVFGCEDGVYSVIYSIDGKRPNFINDPEESRDSYVRHLAGHWYEATYFGW